MFRRPRSGDVLDRRRNGVVLALRYYVSARDDTAFCRRGWDNGRIGVKYVEWVPGRRRAAAIRSSNPAWERIRAVLVSKCKRSGPVRYLGTRRYSACTRQPFRPRTPRDQRLVHLPRSSSAAIKANHCAAVSHRVARRLSFRTSRTSGLSWACSRRRRRPRPRIQALRRSVACVPSSRLDRTASCDVSGESRTSGLGTPVQ